MALSILDQGSATFGEASKQAEVAARDTFLVAVDHLGQYRIDTPFETWLYGITIDVSRRRAAAWRREQLLRKVWNPISQPFRKRAPDGLEQSQSFQDDHAHASRPADEALWQAVCRLKDRLRLPVVLRYYHNMPVAQIGKLLHLSEGVVHARLDNAREKLAAWLE